MKPTPEQEAAVLQALAVEECGGTAADVADEMRSRRLTPYRHDGREVRGWLRHLLIEGKVRRVATGPERWGLADA